MPGQVFAVQWQVDVQRTEALHRLGSRRGRRPRLRRANLLSAPPPVRE